MSLQITTLVENKIGEHLGLQCEHGISFLIKKDDTSILFDLGQKDTFIKNAEKLSLYLFKVKHVVMSHGHYDHTGGFKYLVKKIGNSFKVHIKEDFFKKKYGYNGVSYEYLGNDFDKQYLLDNNIDVTYVKKDIEEIEAGVYIFSNFSRTCLYEQVNLRFRVKNKDKFEIDKFKDEIVVGIETKYGLIIILGCSHPGVINILDTIINRTGKTIYGVIGGTHLVEADNKQIEYTIDYLKKKNIQLIGISHCTGNIACEKIKKINSKFFYNSTGTSIIID